MILYTLASEDGFLIGSNHKGQQWMYLWKDREIAEEFRKGFPSYWIFCMTEEEFLEIQKDQRDLGLTHIWAEKGSEDDGSAITIDKSIEFWSRAVGVPLESCYAAKSSSGINPAFRVNPADFVGRHVPSAMDMLGAAQAGGSSDNVAELILIKGRARIAAIMAEDLGTPISENEAISIAKNSLSPQFIAEPVPLTPKEREIAEEIQFHAWTAFSQQEGITGGDARRMAKQRVAAGERGRTAAMKVGEKAGCVIVLLVVGSVAATVASAAVAACLLPA